MSQHGPPQLVSIGNPKQLDEDLHHRPLGAHIPTDDAESVSPKSSTGSDDSLTAQLLLGQRSALFIKGAMSASSSRSASPPHSPTKDKQATAELLGKPSSNSNNLKATLPKQSVASTTAGSVEANSTQIADQEVAASTTDADAIQNQPAQTSIVYVNQSNAGESGDVTNHVTAQGASETLADAESPSVMPDNSYSRTLANAESSSVELDDSSSKALADAETVQSNAAPDSRRPEESGTAAADRLQHHTALDHSTAATPITASATPGLSMNEGDEAASTSQSLDEAHSELERSHEGASTSGNTAELQRQESLGKASTSSSNQQQPERQDFHREATSSGDTAHLQHQESLGEADTSGNTAHSQQQEPYREAGTSVNTAVSERQESHGEATSSDGTAHLQHQEPHQKAGTTGSTAQLERQESHGEATTSSDSPQLQHQEPHPEAGTTGSTAQLERQGSHWEASTSSSNQQPPERQQSHEGTSPGISDQQPERQVSREQASTSGRHQQQTERQESHGEASTRGSNQQQPDGPLGPSWRQHTKHVLVLSNAGKPIWTLHGDENALAGLMGVVQALTSFVHDKGDAMRSIRAGKHCIVFLERGPFIFVMASATGEPEAVLLGQLKLVHAQILSILTSSVDKTFAKNPSYDARKLLGSTSHVLTSLVTSFGSDPSALLTCLVPLPLKSSLRHSALVFLQSAVKSAGALYGLLLTKKAIVAIAQSRAHMLHPHDALLLANLVQSNESFKQARTFTPVCLPQFNPSAFLHAFVQYLHADSNLCLVLLSAKPDSFFLLAEAAQQVERQCKQSGVMQAVVSTVENQDGEGLLSIAGLPPQCGGGQVGMTPLLHFLYKSPTRAQVIMPAFTAPLDSPAMHQVALQRYAAVHTSMTQKVKTHAATMASSSNSSIPKSQQTLQQQVHWNADGSLAALAYAGPEYELYTLFDAMTDKETATRTCHRLSVWIKGQQPSLFMPL